MRIYRNLRFSRPFFLFPAAVGALVLGGCATAPLGPTIAVMPAPGMPFEQFQAIDASCRQFAQQQAAPYQGGASNSGVTSAALATGIGASAGALIGGNSQGAGVGAGLGLLAGSAGGAGSYGDTQGSAQRAYNIAYQQCMYSRGAQVPGYAAPRYVAPPPPPAYPAQPSYQPAPQQPSYQPQPAYPPTYPPAQ
ncbi:MULTISPECIES: hypothetical protein [unclassified Thiomonas]|uniref:hypothetical protein n=1 Tax=unclassified Thiomonas TaxID=2625466 RepID=UPI0004DB9E4D|nr:MULTISPECIES: hypothetical protein [unclassified Thiomonas]CQR42818.1 conserved exported hypothetical protein [Thiomonas sp. CB3]CDW93392.1 conserved exported hypothetical protein [Thiomonas sp. CB2]VDY05209.1 conserved protein of unknown function [Thiomonas sp. Bio17B3]VDY07627.1 conserved protein of unknown function [Thiomonas sp. Sup16B3]VDY13455.1 conserved hypothetical protein; putative exported protein [Thiomonas sp. OC7]